MTRADILIQVRQIVAEAMEVPSANIHETTAFADLGATDFDRISIIMAAEELADIEVPDEAAETIKTVGGLVCYLAQRLGLVEVAA